MAVAERFLTAVESSVGVERIFSIFGYLHSNIRIDMVWRRRQTSVFLQNV